MSDILPLLFGAIVGFSLGLTGGGGSIFAVPLLVYGLQVAPREAIGISLASVGATALVGAVERWRAGQVEVRPGAIFAAAGMFGAPLGAWLSGFLSEALLLVLFAALMLLVAGRMWRKATAPPAAACEEETGDGPTCRRDLTGNLILNSRCSVLLILLGVVAGVLSGLFGVGGGFVIVPALVLFSGMPIQRAVATSLMVIALVSVSGVASFLWAGRTISLSIAAPFVAGGVAGMFAGNAAGRKLSGPALQKVFAVAIVLVAVFVIVQTLT